MSEKNVKSDTKQPLPSTNPTKRYVEGPIGVVEMHNKSLKKRIFLFADRHTRDTSCGTTKTNVTTLPLLLDTILKQNSSETIDVFSEVMLHAEYPSFPFKPTSGYMAYDLFHTLQASNCLWDKSKKDECLKRYPNARFHNVDIRYTDILGVISMFTNAMSNKLDQIQTMNVDELSKLDISTNEIVEIQKLYMQLECYFGKNLGKLTFENLFLFPKIKLEKYFKATDLPLDNLARHPSTLKRYELPIFELYTNFMNVIRVKGEKIESKHYEYLDDLLVKCTYSLVWLMDLYSTQRFMKPYIFNGLLFAGSLHIYNQIEIFKLFGFELVQESPRDFQHYKPLDFKWDYILKSTTRPYEIFDSKYPEFLDIEYKDTLFPRTELAQKIKVLQCVDISNFTFQFNK